MEPSSSAPPNPAHSNTSNPVNQQPSLNENATPTSLSKVLSSSSVNLRDTPHLMPNWATDPAGLDQSGLSKDPEPAGVNFLDEPPLPKPQHPADELPAPHEDAGAASTPDTCCTDTDGSIIPAESSNGLPEGSLAKVDQDSDSDNEGTVILLRELIDSAKQDMDSLHTAISSLQGALESEALAEKDRARVRHYLIKALLTRYGLHGWVEDLEGSFGHLMIMVRNIDDLKVMAPEEDENMNEVQVASQLIQACRNSINIDTLNSVVCIAEEDLQSSTNVRSGIRNVGTLIELGNALVMSYLHHGQTSGLDLAVAKFQQAKSAEFEGHTSLRYISALSLVHVELLQLIECGDLEALHRLRAYWTEACGIDQKAEALYQMGTQMMLGTSDEQLKTAIALLDSSLQHRMTPHPRRAASLNNLGVVCMTRFRREGDFEDLKQSIMCHREALDLQPAPHPRRAGSLNNLANALSTRFEQKGAFEDLEECIQLHRKGLGLHPPPHTNYSISLNNLAAALFTRFEQKGAFVDLDESILLYQEVFNLHSAPHPIRSTASNNLANALLTRFKQNGGSQDFEKSVVLYQEALDLVSHPNRSTSLNSLANALFIGFYYMGAVEDLDQCILLLQEALNLHPAHHPIHSMTLNNLGNALSTRFKHKGALQDLDECILLHQKALSLHPNPHPNRSTSLNNLANALFSRFRQKGVFQDLNECIWLYGEALKLRPAPHPDRSASLNNLANALCNRFEQKGSLQDLDECIVLYQDALKLQTTSHPDYTTSLNGLAVALSARFKEKGAYTDLDHCILLHRDILKLQHATHPDRSSKLGNVPNELIPRFKQKGTFQVLSDSNLLPQDVFGSQPASHSNHSSFLNNLAITLYIRYKHKGIFQDLEECIALYRQALNLHSAQHPDRSRYLNNLATALLASFQRNGTSRNLEECTLLYREALNLHSAPHPNRSRYLNNLATTLLTCFEQNGTPSDLEECILLYREALNLHPAPHPNRSMSLDNLASALLACFEQKRDFQVLDECILLYQEALQSRPVPHPGRLLSLNNLAHIFLVCNEHKGALKNCNLALLTSYDDVFCDLESQLKSGQDDIAVQIAVNCFEAAAKYQTGSLLERIQTAKHWAFYAEKYHSSSALHAYQYAMSLIPLLASLDLTLQQRQDVLQNTQALVGNAAKFAITADQYDMAVVFLSTGRSVFWAQALQLRHPIDKLAVMHPALAERFSTLSKKLEEASFYNQHSTSELDSNLHLSQDESSYTLADQQHHTIGEIRKTPGFAEFLQPPSFAMLQSAASHGPVVLLNASESGCDALILHEKEPTEHIPLSDICLEELQALKGLFHTLMHARTRAIVISKDTANILQKLLKRDMALEDSCDSNEVTFQSALGCLWTKVVQPVIGALALNKSDSPSGIWWCPAGPFSSLPIHAAGIYSEDSDPVDCLFEYAVSSYCTSPQDLLHPNPKITESFKMTAIIEPNAPGAAPLPATLRELVEIGSHIPNHQHHLITHIGSQSSPISLDDLLTDIQKSTFTHFGCHGMQHLNNPLESSLLLSGGRLTMFKIIKECQVPEGALAYLSACETAKGDEARPNESLNLVATMMFAGFRSVVGTMWSIFDEDAPLVADVFYGHLFRNGEKALPNVRDAAYGLHLATKELRKQGKSFQSWVPYVHYGI